jgi:hypothetical protein
MRQPAALHGSREPLPGSSLEAGGSGPALDAVLPRGITDGVALVTKTVKLPRELATALSRKAAEFECSESELIREGIAKILAEDGIDMQVAIGADLGIGKGPSDLSSNRSRMSRYGRPRHR